MGRVGHRLRADSQALDREVDALDVASLTRTVIVSIRALTDADAGASVPGRPHGAAGPLPGSAGYSGKEANDEFLRGQQKEVHAAEISDELHRCVRCAVAGDPSSARRVAELLEVAGFDELAALWWGRAAELGDPDAADYLEEILGKDSSTSVNNPRSEHDEGRVDVGQDQATTSALPANVLEYLLKDSAGRVT